MSTNDFILRSLANITDDYTRCELSDWAVNTLREGYDCSGATDRAGLATMIREETARIQASNLDLLGYLRARRAGSRFRLSRNLRRIVYAACAARTPAIVANAIPYDVALAARKAVDAA